MDWEAACEIRISFCHLVPVWPFSVTIEGGKEAFLDGCGESGRSWTETGSVKVLGQFSVGFVLADDCIRCGIVGK